jgi:arginyl-tRNA synthetase
MSSIKAQLTELFSKTFKECGYESTYGLVVESQRPDLCQFQCNGALAVAKSAKHNPRDIAQNIIDRVKNSDILDKLTIAGPGFINITVTDNFIGNHINSINNDGRLGCPSLTQMKNVVIDFGSPNVAKPMHVGHLRSAIIGDSLQRLFTFMGYTVTGDNHIGDWGTQMGMLICELKSRQPDLTYFDSTYTGPYPEEPPVSVSDLEEMYPVANKRCKEDDKHMADAIAATDELQRGRKGYIALWKHFVNLSIPALKEDFSRLNIFFDHWYGESFYTERMKKLVKRLQAEGHAVISEEALVLPVTEKNDSKEIPPVMLVKSNGGFLYGTSDIATIEFRRETFNADIILYVVDKRQSLHFEQVFRAVRKTGIATTDTVLEHVGFGTVNGPDGKPFKTRAGGVMKLSDLIAQVTQKAEERMKEAGIAQDLSQEEYKDIAQKVGIAALKFADLINHRLSDYTFDIDKFCRFEGKTGPYLLYTAVRIKSILRKAEESNISRGEILAPQDQEKELMLLLSGLPDVLKNAEENYAPNYICDFAYNLSQEFNRFYKDCHILREKDKKLQGSWLALSTLCLKELELLLRLLGIEIPERM